MNIGKEDNALSGIGKEDWRSRTECSREEWWEEAVGWTIWEGGLRVRGFMKETGGMGKEKWEN